MCLCVSAPDRAAEGTVRSWRVRSKKCLEVWVEAGSCQGVKRFRIIAALMLLAFWAPISSHELLEHWGIIHVQASHAAEKHSDDHDAADGLCRLPGWAFQIQKYQGADIS